MRRQGLPRAVQQGAKAMCTTWHTTCLRRGAGCKAFHRFWNSFTSSLTPTGPCMMCRLPLPAPRVHTTVGFTLHRYLLLQVRVFCYCVTCIMSHLPPKAATDMLRSPLPFALATILSPGLRSLESWIYDFLMLKDNQMSSSNSITIFHQNICGFKGKQMS